MNDPLLAGISDIVVAKAPERICCMGLGSCVAVFLYDPESKIGGVLHALLPNAVRDTRTPTKYTDTGIPRLIDAVRAKGADRSRLRAKLVGGAQMFPNLNITVSDIGKTNVTEAKKTLRRLGIRVVSEDTFGNRGRSATFDLETGRVTITTAFSEERII
jgi:chemotaxis protein CheD